jgi:hypothetical protein
MTQIPVIVLVDDGADLQKVTANCARYGLTQVRALPRLGILKGLIEKDRMAELTKAPGVRSVEKEREVKLPPPRSPVQ